MTATRRLARTTLALAASALGALPAPAPAGSPPSLRVLAVRVPHGALGGMDPCAGPARPTAGATALGVAAVTYAWGLSLCAGGSSPGLLEAARDEPSVGYLPTRTMPDGRWVTERDGPALVRARSAAARDLDFQPADALGTLGPTQVVEAGRLVGEPEGLVITVSDAESARWFASATGWVADPDRLPSAPGTAMLATCYSAAGTCVVTVPVCDGVGVEFEVGGVRDPQGLGPALSRGFREARDALGCG